MREKLFLTGRVIVGLFYVMNGFNHFTKLEMMTSFAEGAGVPLPGLAVIGTGALLLAAGLSILLGYKPDIGVGLLVLFYLPVTFMMHGFWAYEGQQQMQQMIHFMKNMALMGSALIYLGVPQPWPKSLGARG